MSNNVNLLEQNKNTIVPVKKLQVFRMIAVGLLFIVSVSSVIMFILVALSPLPGLKRQEQSLRLTLAQSQTDMGKLALIDERANSIQEVLSKRKSLDQTIALIQSKTPGDVTINELQIDKEKVTLTVQSNSLQSLDSFLSGLIQAVQEKKVFSQITLNDLATDSSASTYSMTVHLVML